MNRRMCLQAAVAAFATSYLAGSAAQSSQPASGAPSGLRDIAVLDFELVDDQNNPATKAAVIVRLRNATQQLRRELAERKLYRVVDAAPAQDLLRTLRDQQEFLYRCNDCASQIGKQLGTDLVMVTWVQKVSELILNLNVQIFDVALQKVVFTKSVDMRGNQDESWTRAVSYLVRDMAEKRAIRPNYGL